MPQTATAGHGALIAVELSAPGGAFVTVGELNGDITWPEISRPVTDVTPHQATIDRNILGVMKRGPLTFSINWVLDSLTAQTSAAELYEMIQDNLQRGFRLRGPGSVDATDEWIMSGQVQAITQVAPVREGARTCEVTVQMSGPMKIDGTEFGADISA